MNVGSGRHRSMHPVFVLFGEMWVYKVLFLMVPLNKFTLSLFKMFLANDSGGKTKTDSNPFHSVIWFFLSIIS